LRFNPLKSEIRTLCIETFTKYLDDPEAEVRKAVCLHLEKFFENLGNDEQHDNIIKQFKKIGEDTQLFVKSTL